MVMTKTQRGGNLLGQGRMRSLEIQNQELAKRVKHLLEQDKSQKLLLAQLEERVKQTLMAKSVASTFDGKII